jgi:hypothetical protein
MKEEEKRGGSIIGEKRIRKCRVCSGEDVNVFLVSGFVVFLVFLFLVFFVLVVPSSFGFWCGGFGLGLT